jgi:hypothetical protein
VRSQDNWNGGHIAEEEILPAEETFSPADETQPDEHLLLLRQNDQRITLSVQPLWQDLLFETSPAGIPHVREIATTELERIRGQARKAGTCETPTGTSNLGTPTTSPHNT